MLVVQGLLLLTTPTANAACKLCGREGHNARTCPQRGTGIQPVQQQQPQGRQQGCSICGEPGHNARTHAQHAAAAATAAAAERTARGEYVCGYCQRIVSCEECARWLRQLFSVACDASPHFSKARHVLFLGWTPPPPPKNPSGAPTQAKRVPICSFLNSASICMLIKT